MIAIEAIDCGSKLERAVEDRRIQDGPVERCRIGGGGGGRRSRRLVLAQAGKAGERPVGRRLAERFRLAHEGVRSRPREFQQAGQALEEVLLARIQPTIGLAHPDRQLEGELAQVRLAQPGHRRLQAEPAEQDVLVERDEVDLRLAPERFGDLAHMVALYRPLVTVGEGRMQADRDEGTGLLWIQVHGRTPRWKTFRLGMGGGASSAHDTL
jgi:hypothetical protein